MSDLLALPVETQRRVKAAAALLASDKEGEATAALRATKRLLAPHGLTIADVIGAGIDNRPPAPKPNRPDPAPLLRPHQKTARMAMAFPELLNEWELSFLDGIAGRKDITDRQQDTLNGIASKIERGRK